MGCFLACFGLTKKKKRPKGSSKNVSGDQSHGKYVPLDSDVTVKFDSNEMQNSSATKLRDKPKESATANIKKKVSFNLNVRTYEPLPNKEISTYHSEGEEKTLGEYNEEETAGASMKYLNYEENMMASKFRSFPSNCRYQNCRDSYDEEDEIELEESDLDGDDEDDLEFDEDEDDIGESYDHKNQKTSQVKFNQSNSASVEEEEKVGTDQLGEERRSNRMQLQALQGQELNKSESNQNAPNRSLNVFSVLTPVENLTQWKEVKAKSRQQLKHQKENIILEQEQHMPSLKQKSSDPSALNSSENLNHCKLPTREIAVDTSLSNWLVSSGQESNAKDSHAAIGEWHQRKSKWMHQTRSVDKRTNSKYYTTN